MEEDIMEIKKSISEDELNMLVAYITLKSLGDDKMLGLSYRDLLDDAKKLREEFKQQEEEEKSLALKAKSDEADRIKRLGSTLTVSLFAKDFSEYDYQEYITYKFAFENKSDKDIKAFTGTIVFNDLFDKEISNLSLTYDDGVLAKSTKSWDAQTDYNQFLEKDVTLRSKEIEDLKIKWIPEKIIFSDNSTLE